MFARKLRPGGKQCGFEKTDAAIFFKNQRERGKSAEEMRLFMLHILQTVLPRSG
jgi:hypothetical protein